MRRQIMKVIERDINPAIAGHNGSVELVDYVDKNIFLRMLGGCQGCASSTATLRNGIERILRESFGDDVREIIDVTNHDEGQTPYFAPSQSGTQTPFA
jgi:Fe-S cluster biogenesis protein NfuA